MDPLIVPKTRNTPDIHLNYSTGLISVRGNSFPNNAVEFYRPVLQWIRKYTQQAPESTQIILEPDYFNSTSNKIITDILFLLSRLREEGKEVHLKWLYPEGDEDLLEWGKAVEHYIQLPVAFEAVPMAD